jgi:hypothetical protein
LTKADVISLAVVALAAVIPLAVVLMVALLRGYTIHLSMWRPGFPRRRGRPEDDT